MGDLERELDAGKDRMSEYYPEIAAYALPPDRASSRPRSSGQQSRRSSVAAPPNQAAAPSQVALLPTRRPWKSVIDRRNEKHQILWGFKARDWIYVRLPGWGLLRLRQQENNAQTELDTRAWATDIVNTHYLIEFNYCPYQEARLKNPLKLHYRVLAVTSLDTACECTTDLASQTWPRGGVIRVAQPYNATQEGFRNKEGKYLFARYGDKALVKVPSAMPNPQTQQRVSSQPQTRIADSSRATVGGTPPRPQSRHVSPARSVNAVPSTTQLQPIGGAISALPARGPKSPRETLFRRKRNI